MQQRPPIVLHITPSYKPAWIYGGPTLSVSRLCESQAALGAEVLVWTTTANGMEELNVTSGKEGSLDGVAVTYFRRITGDHTHLSPSLLWQVWRGVRGFDFVHIHSWWNLVTIPAVLICWLRGVRPVLSPRGMLSTYGASASRRSIKRIFQRSLGRWLLSKTVLHATSEQEVQEGQEWVRGWPYFMAPNIINLPKNLTHSQQEVDSPEFQLLFLSRIHHKKGLDLLFEALATIGFPWKLSVAGAGEKTYLDELNVLARKLGIEENVTWLGWVNQEEKYYRLQQADLLVLTSRNENFGNVVIESLAVGTPVLLSDQVGAAEWIRREDLGWITGLSVSDIAESLEKTYKAVDKRVQIRQHAPAKTYYDFDAEKIAMQYLDQYSKLQESYAGH